MYLLFDIGATNTRLGISKDGSTLEQKIIYPTPATIDEAMVKIKSSLIEFKNTERIEVIAGGIAATLDRKKSSIVKSPNLQNWIGKPFKKSLEEVFNCPVYLGNDAALVGIAESIKGFGIGSNIVAYITVSTGVGGARITNGKVDENTLGFQPGHQYISTSRELKTLEDLVSGTGLQKKYQTPAEKIKDQKIWDEVAYHLAIGLHNTIVHWSPDIVILGGSVMKSIDINKVNENLKKIMKIFDKVPPVVKSNLDQFAGLYGAMELIKSNNMKKSLLAYSLQKPFHIEK